MTSSDSSEWNNHLPFEYSLRRIQGISPDSASWGCCLQHSNSRQRVGGCKAISVGGNLLEEGGESTALGEELRFPLQL